jgi:hypothetical protein
VLLPAETVFLAGSFLATETAREIVESFVPYLQMSESFDDFRYAQRIKKSQMPNSATGILKQRR